MTESTRPTLSTGIYYRDPLAALKWLEEAFGFEPTMVVTAPDGSLLHSEMRLGDGMIMIGGERDARHQSPLSLGGANTHGVHVQLTTGIDDHCDRARKAGATIDREPADQPYGDRVYTAFDLEGHSWSFGQTVQVLGQGEMAEATGSTIRERA